MTDDATTTGRGTNASPAPTDDDARRAWAAGLLAAVAPTVTMSEPTRQSAEEQVRVILELPRCVLALLVYALGKAGWTQGDAERELRAAKWWLG
jgi:hypothetical protein